MSNDEWYKMMQDALDKQKQEFIKGYIKTYGEYPECYADEKED